LKKLQGGLNPFSSLESYQITTKNFVSLIEKAKILYKTGTILNPFNPSRSSLKLTLTIGEN
jgi:hypothetical protein